MNDVAKTRTVSATLAGWGRSLNPVPSAFRIRDERTVDVGAREALLDACFGRQARLAKTCERLREGRLAAGGLSFTAVREGALVGTLRLWHVEAGNREALMLGPLAVCPTARSAGIGGAMVEHALRRARKAGHGAVILVGDAPYYGRFGFSRDLTAGLTLPGPVDESRFLGLELVPGALSGSRGRVVGTGLFVDGRVGGGDRRAA